MSIRRILYVTTTLYPYQNDCNIGKMVNKMALKMYNEGNDVRVFMPKFGKISDRKFQLHEVIRLSGINLIINDIDQPLIVKVASLPGERMQVYFTDNDEYFKRKYSYFDQKGKAFEDNDERAVFFARGVIETIKKLNWVPDVIHLNGWMSSFIPIYLKFYYKNDSYFRDTQFIMSLYNEEDASLYEKIEDKLRFDDVLDLEAFKNATFQSFVAESMNMVDLVIKGDESLDKYLNEKFLSTKTQKRDYVDGDFINEVY